MGFADDVANNAKETVGKAKEAIGDATDNQDLKADGLKDQAAAKVDQVKDNVKDAINDLKN